MKYRLCFIAALPILVTLAFSAALLLFGVTPGFAAAVAAATPALHDINVHAASPTLITYIFAGLATLASALIGHFTGKNGKLNLDAESQQYLEHAVTMGLTIAQAKVTSYAANMKDPQVKSETVAVAANFVLAAVPTLLAHLGITPEKLQTVIAAKLGQQAAAAPPAAGQ